MSLSVAFQGAESVKKMGTVVTKVRPFVGIDVENGVKKKAGCGIIFVNAGESIIFEVGKKPIPLICSWRAVRMFDQFDVVLYDTMTMCQFVTAREDDARFKQGVGRLSEFCDSVDHFLRIREEIMSLTPSPVDIDNAIKVFGGCEGVEIDVEELRREVLLGCLIQTDLVKSVIK